ncbi:MAG: hypothetical protein E7447_02515 [Ruminococcaceae bacterium]|nr:hypothetical protein [Oscillospiraceae bacterium]
MIMTPVRTTGSKVIDSDGVVKITAQASHGSQSRTYTDPEKINQIIAYFDNLSLVEEANPEGVMGGGWQITYTYADGSTFQIIHSGNVYLHLLHPSGTKNYHMVYEEANAFDRLIYDLPSD